MYLAPLNADRFFKKVFSDLEIAKAFLEDVLDATVESIEVLSVKHKVTDSSIGVEFDFRCKVNGKPIIIDMQQWYKTDIIRRFYVYHAISTALQLETLATKSIPAGKDKKKKTRDYSSVEPVVTLVWMVNDTFGSSEDSMCYSLSPEAVCEFVMRNDLWQNPNLATLVFERENVLALLKNDTKSLDFLSKNRLIFLFQPNIVKNKKDSKYFRWFDFAEKTRKKNNSKADFLEYETDKIMGRIVERINNQVLEEADFEYITDWDEFHKEVKLWEAGIRREAQEEAIALGEQKGIKIGEQKGIKIGEQKGIKIGEQKGIKIGEAKARAEEKKKRHREKLEIALFLLKEGFPIEKIMAATKLSREEIEKLKHSKRLK